MKIRKKKRRDVVAKPQDTEKKSMDVAAFLAHNPTKSRGTRRTAPPITTATKDAEKRARTGEWEDATARSFVGLYALCHRLTYGVPAAELEDKGSFRTATRIATKSLHDHFDDDKAEFVEFIKWTWIREREREEWATRNGKQRGRLGFRIQFSASLVTDYRVDMSRQRNRRSL